MTDTEINIAIAEACGWKPHPDGQGYYQGAFHAFKKAHPLPSCTTDLNAMYEAEETLKMDNAYTYGEHVRKISGNIGERGGHFVPNGFGCFQMTHLTARQRAEAFLRTLGKWKD